MTRDFNMYSCFLDQFFSENGSNHWNILQLYLGMNLENQKEKIRDSSDDKIPNS